MRRSTIGRFLQDHSLTVTKWMLVAFAVFASRYIAYLVVGGRTGILEALVGLGILAGLWQAIGPTGLLSLLTMFVWSSRYAPSPFYKYTNPLWEWAYVIEVGIWAWLVFMLSSEVVQKRRGRNKFVMPPYWGVLAVFLLGGVLAFLTGVSPSRQFAWRMLWHACITPLAMYILVTNVVKTPKDGERVLLALLVGGLILAAVVLTGWGIITGTLEDYYARDRVYGVYDVGPLGRHTIVAINNGALYFGLVNALAFSLALNGRHLWQRWLGIGSVAVLSVVILWMGTRSAWLALVVAVLMMTILSARRRVTSIGRAVVLLVGLVAVGIVTVRGQEQISEVILNRMQTVTSTSLLLTDSQWLERMALWRSGITILLRNPLGTGWMAIPVLPVPVAPHSEYLALALITGIPGLLAFLSFLVLCTRRLLIAISNGDSSGDWVLPGALGSLVVFLVATIATDPSRRFYPYITFWIIISVAMAVTQKNRPQQPG